MPLLKLCCCQPGQSKHTQLHYLGKECKSVKIGSAVVPQIALQILLANGITSQCSGSSIIIKVLE